MQAPGLNIDVLGHPIVLLQNRLTLAYRHLVLVLAEAQQFAKAPHAREIQPVIPAGPPFAKVAQFAGNLDLVPVIADVQQLAARRTFEHRLPAIELGPAIGVDALLISCLSHIVVSRISYRVFRPRTPNL